MEWKITRRRVVCPRTFNHKKLKTAVKVGPTWLVQPHAPAENINTPGPLITRYRCTKITQTQYWFTLLFTLLAIIHIITRQSGEFKQCLLLCRRHHKRRFLDPPVLNSPPPVLLNGSKHCQSINQAINQTSYQAINRSINQSIKHSDVHGSNGPIIEQWTRLNAWSWILGAGSNCPWCSLTVQWFTVLRPFSHVHTLIKSELFLEIF